jgi:hypothetical protein
LTTQGLYQSYWEKVAVKFKVMVIIAERFTNRLNVKIVKTWDYMTIIIA